MKERGNELFISKMATGLGFFYANIQWFSRFVKEGKGTALQEKSEIAGPASHTVQQL